MTICRTHKAVHVSYSAPVAGCARRLRVFPPPQRGAQRVLDLRWRCEPAADRARESQDEFGNSVLDLAHARLAGDFRFAVELVTERLTHAARSERAVPPAGGTPAGGTLEGGTFAAPREEGVPATGIGAFLLPSALCESVDEVRRVVRHLEDTHQIAAREPERSAARLCAWAHRALQYSPGATGPHTTVGEALQRGAGVCQDYAHLMIALCRAFALPARYVSGYSPGEGQMHAWVEVLCGAAWRAFDPTHNRPTRADCVFVASGRDFRDVSPLRGSFSGHAQAQLKTWCETLVL